jgi:conjugal transfer pilus assembly protein TraF
MRPCLHLVAAALLTAICLSAAAQAPPSIREKPRASEGWLADRERGWFFYEVKPDPPPPPDPTRPPPPPVGGGGSGSGQADGEPVMSTAWLRENLPRFRDAAIDNPSDENVKLFYYMQRLVLDRASAFGDAAMRVVNNTPALDERNRQPISAYAQSAARQAANATIKKVMSRVRERAGLLYFFRSDCGYCMRQTSALTAFINVHRVEVTPVSLDGAGMPDGSFPDYRVDDGQGDMLGVAVTPTFVMAIPETGEFITLAAGLQTSSQLEDRLLEQAHRRGWVSDHEWSIVKQSTRKFLQDVIPPGTTPTDPAVLLAILEASGESAGSTPITSSPSTGPMLP